VRANCSLLCNSAETRDDGLLNILGGGITSVTPESFPVMLSGLKLALNVSGLVDELIGEHQIEVVFKRGAELVSRVHVEFTARDPAGTGEATFSLVIPLDGVALPQPDDYDVNVEFDSSPLAEISLYARLPDVASTPDTGG
jgi:hypothetical protein